MNIYKNISKEASDAIDTIGPLFDQCKSYFIEKISNLTTEEIDLLSYNMERELSLILAEERIKEGIRRYRKQKGLLKEK